MRWSRIEVWFLQRWFDRNGIFPWHRLTASFLLPAEEESEGMIRMQGITPAKRKRLLTTFGTCPAGYTHDDLERLLDVLYGMFSAVYTMAELRQIVVSDPFDRSEHPRQLTLVELTDWLEAIVA